MARPPKKVREDDGWIDRPEKAKGDKATSLKALSKPLESKLFADMSAKDKGDLLRALAIKAGLIEG